MSASFPIVKGSPEAAEAPAAPEPAGVEAAAAKRAAEAAQAVARARAAAAERLRQAARAAAARSPLLRAPVKSEPLGPPRRAPRDLVEQPPVAGEVILQPKAPPTVQAPQILVAAEAIPAAPAEAAAPSSSSAPARAPEIHRKTTHPLPIQGQEKRARLAPRRAADPEARKKTELVDTKLLGVPGRRYYPVHILLGVAACVACALLLRYLGPASRRPTPARMAAGDALGAIERAIDMEDWQRAVQLSAEALKKQPQDPVLLQKHRLAETELGNRSRYEGYRAAVQRHDDEAALALFKEFGEGSAYQERVRREAQHLREAYIGTHLAAARSARRSGQCREAQRQAQAVLAVDPAHEEAQALLARCTAEPKATAEKRAGRSNKADKGDDSRRGALRNPFE